MGKFFRRHKIDFMFIFAVMNADVASLSEAQNFSVKWRIKASLIV